MKNIVSLFLLFILLASCSDIERTREALEESAQVYSEDAFNILNIAKDLNASNAELHERSLAQIVFHQEKGVPVPERTPGYILLGKT